MQPRKAPIATILASLAVAVSLLLPSSEMPQIEVVGIDKLAHVALFGLWALALRLDWKAFRRRPWLLIAAAAIIAPLSETLQLLSPGRAFELGDMAADLLGAALAAAFGAPLIRIAERLAGRLGRNRAG